jgi:hypothetical protein
MRLRVECYSGRKADERPVRFRLGERDYLVEEMLDQWYVPDETFFKVRADDRNLYIFRHRHDAADEWSLEAFREIRK